jgi:hypothetical protein
VVRTVVAAASVTTIVIDAIVVALADSIVDAVVPSVMMHLMLGLLMVGRIIAAAARLCDGGYRDRPGES